MWLLVNFKLHIWLALYFDWIKTVLALVSSWACRNNNTKLQRLVGEVWGESKGQISPYSLPPYIWVHTPWWNVTLNNSIASRIRSGLLVSNEEPVSAWPCYSLALSVTLGRSLHLVEP